MGKNNKKKIIKRIIITLLLFVSVFVLSWWGVVILSILFVTFFKNPYEVIVTGAMMDSLYSAPLLVSDSLNIFYTIFFLTLFALSFYIKEKIIYTV